MSERDYNTGADSVVTTDPYVIVRENDSYVCDIKVKGSLYQQAKDILRFKVQSIEADGDNNVVQITLSLVLRTSSFSSYNYTYSPTLNSPEDLSKLLDALFDQNMSLDGNSRYTFEECSKMCGKVEDCAVNYCDMFSLKCSVLYLDGLPCQSEGYVGVCKEGKCVVPESPVVSEPCPDVRCISSECTTRYLDEDTCTCKETRLNGKECDGGKGICDNGVCKPKDSYFASATSVTITLEAPYENGTIKESESFKRVSVSHVPGHGTYMLNLKKAYVGAPPINSVKIGITATLPGEEIITKYSDTLYVLLCHNKSEAEVNNNVTTTSSVIQADEIDAKKGVIYTCDIAPLSTPFLGEKNMLDIVVKEIEVDYDKVRATVLISFNPLIENPPVTQACSNVQCSDDLPNCRVASCYGGKCQYAPAPVGTPCGENSYCNAQGECVTQVDTSASEPEPPTPYTQHTYNLVFIPVSWDEGEQRFQDVAIRTAQEFIKMAGLTNCADKVDVLIANIETVKDRCPNVELKESLTEIQQAMLLERVKRCAIELFGLPENADNYRIIGLSDNQIIYSISNNPILYKREKLGGYTYFGENTVISLYKPRMSNPLPPCSQEEKARERIFMVVHELGHTFNLCDQYEMEYYVREYNTHGCANYYPGEINWRGVVMPYKKCPYNAGIYLTNCPDIPAYFCGSLDCFGRKIPYEGIIARSVMGASNAEGPRPFDCFELDAIKSRWSC
jgi:hypothetical protein